MKTKRYTPRHKAVVIGTQHSPMLDEFFEWLHYYSKKYTKEQVFFKGRVVKKIFKNGEFLFHMGESVREAEVFIFAQPRFKKEYLHGDIFEVLELIRSAKNGNAQRVHLIIPTIPYARQDRITRDREFPSFRLFTDMLKVAGIDTVTTFDIHNDATVGYMKWSMQNISMTSFIAKVVKENIIDVYGENVSLCSPDFGGAKSIEKLSQKIFNRYGINLNSIIIEKYRDAGTGKTKIKSVIGKPKKHVVLIDDMIDTGGTAGKASRFLRENHGVEKTFMFATHPIFSSGVKENMERAQFEQIFTTNSCWFEYLPKIENHTIISMAKMIAGVMDNIHNKKTVTGFVNEY